MRSWARTWHRSSGHAEAASHTPQPEALTTRIYNYVLGDFGENKKKKKRLATVVSPGAKLKKKKGSAFTKAALIYLCIFYSIVLK